MQQKIRHLLQAIFFILLSYLGARHVLLGGGSMGAAPVDAYCPFGGLESLYKFAAAGTFIKRTNFSNLVLLVAVILTALLAGRAFCSWICPLGTMQEWLLKLGQKIGIRTIRVPHWLDRPLRYVKYGVLMVFLALTWWTGELVFRAYDPWVAFNHLWEGIEAAFSSFPAGTVILLLILLSSLLIDRIWCRYLCPLGALLAIFSRLGLLRQPVGESCNNCRACARTCTLQVIDGENRVDTAECIACGRCQEKCSRDARRMQWLGSKVTPLGAGLLAVAIFWGSYALARAAGLWITLGGGRH